jgi:phage baseplate assembly protein W
MPVPSIILFSDFNINFTPHPITGDIGRLTNNDAVIQAVKLLVLTNHYERLFQPEIGSNVSHYLFENFSPYVEENIRSAIEDVLTNFESRIELLDVQVGSDIDNNGFTASIIFRVVNDVEPISLDVFLERIR